MRLLLGRLLEAIGLSLLPFGLYLGIFHDRIREELACLGIGAALFVLGYLLERPYRR